MIRKFVAGIFWGSVVSVIGLVVVSQVAPMPGKRLAVPAAPAPAQVAAPITPPAPTPPAPVALPESPVVPAMPEASTAQAPRAVAPSALAEAPQPPAPPVSTVPAPSVPRATQPQVAAAPVAPLPASGADAPPPAAELPPPPAAGPAEALLTPPPAAAPDPAPALIVPDAPAPAEPAAQPATEPAEPVELQPTQPETLPPTPGLPQTVDGVTTDRLPHVGDAPVAAAAPADRAGTPLQLYARSFDNPAGKPLFSILLQDTGAADLDRATLAALPFPVTFVIDPLAANAAEAEAIYRAAGQEVVMLASGLPAGATPADVEQSFQTLTATLPESLAVVDLPEGGFQDDRALAGAVLPILQAQGRGLLTFDRGLNAADQIARRDKVPAATIFRRLDAEGEDGPLIRRYLDRAAFKAAQEGRVVVLGSARPETVKALMEWSVEGRAASVALAPASAVLVTN